MVRGTSLQYTVQHVRSEAAVKNIGKREVEEQVKRH